MRCKQLLARSWQEAHPGDLAAVMIPVSYVPAHFPEFPSHSSEQSPINSSLKLSSCMAGPTPLT